MEVVVNAIQVGINSDINIGIHRDTAPQVWFQNTAIK